MSCPSGRPRALVLLARDLLLGRGLGGGGSLAALGGKDEGDEVLDERGPRKSRKLQKGRKRVPGFSVRGLNLKESIFEVLLVAKLTGSRLLVLVFGPTLGMGARCPAGSIMCVFRV